MTTPGLVTRQSAHSVDDTVARVAAMLHARGVTLFATIDHSGEAAKVSLALRPTRLMIFGDPRAGTPLMVAAPTIAIDLPLKLLVWEGDDGTTQVTFNAAAWLAERHGLPPDMATPLGAVVALATAAGAP